ncbi:lysoplasmalogenase family protein [Micromonospora sp. DT81.3]|uniref:lysoplasmalogenase family protein n=1 Tax=Micromonospora sp. DT81.3 TaxID=3416523 RepID=UPI003CF09338
MSAVRAPSAVATRPLWWGFAPYAVLSLVHVVALAVGSDDVAAPTKLTLMPALALAVLWGGRGGAWGAPYTLLLLAIAFSWLGDGAGAFFPFAGDPLPLMLLFFGLAHLCYICLFWKHLAVRALPGWAAVYAVWWLGLLLVLWPSLGGLSIAVAVYGLVLGGTAALAARCHTLVVWGGAFFLASDTVLAFRIFLPDAMPGWTSPLVMLTYTLGQGLIAAGAIVTLRRRAVVV